MRSFYPVLVSFVLLFACKSEVPYIDDKGEESNKLPILSAWVEDLAAESVILKGNIIFASTVSSDYIVGFQYSKSPVIQPSGSSTTTVEIEKVDSQNNYAATVSGLDPNTQYYYRLFLHQPGKITYGETRDFTTLELDVPDGAVDLGIVMVRQDGTSYNLFWAESNLSENGLCDNPEDFGDYYAWGELEPFYLTGHNLDDPCNSWRVREDHPITGYDWTSYKWCNGIKEKLTKYCPAEMSDFWDVEGEPDGKTDLSDYYYEDDAARAELGGKWRIPTYAEWSKLRSQCKWTPTHDYNGTGVYGWIVTGKRAGAPEKSIFIPAAGHRSHDRLFDAGTYGTYSLSSICLENPVYNMGIDFFTINQEDVTGIGPINTRCFGYPIRPVSE